MTSIRRIKDTFNNNKRRALTAARRRIPMTTTKRSMTNARRRTLTTPAIRSLATATKRRLHDKLI